MNDLKIGAQRPAAIQVEQNQKNESTLDFGQVIKGAMDSVNKMEQTADGSIMDLLKGKADINESMIALQKMDISMRLLLTIRNKAVEAYKEIFHMQF